MPAAKLTQDPSDEVIDNIIAEIGTSAKKWLEIRKQNQLSEAGDIEVSRSKTRLINKIWSLYSTVKGPADMIYDHASRFCHTGATRAVLELGVFEALPVNGETRTAKQLSESLGVEKQLLVRLMRNATAIGPLAEVGPETYAHTDLSRAYLDPGMRGFFLMTMDEYMGVSATTHEYLKKNGYKNPTSPTDNPYTYYHKTGGLAIFEWMAKHPERLKNFNLAMTAGSSEGAGSVSLFPFKQTLSQYRTTVDTPLVVDVGGGRGHAAQMIREELDGVPGRVILEDQASAIAEVKDQLPDIEKIAQNFFEPQPAGARGAKIYFLRRILHDWGDEACVKILRQLADVMTPESRVVINEFLMPDAGAGPEACWADFVMLTFGGTERTAGQFEELFHAAGMELVKIHASKTTDYVALEAKLK